MDPVDAYLRIPAGYCRALGELRWSGDGEAVEFASGGTFAFGGEIVSFLEGISLHRALPPFGHVLHLLGILRHQRNEAADELTRLHRAFRQAGQVHRNAGVFCAVLCRDLPAAAEAPTSQQVWRRVVLRSFNAAPELVHRRWWGEEPALAPREAEDAVRQALSRYDDAELLHWLKHGHGPIREPARKIAEVLHTDRPRSLLGVLGDLMRHERLSGALPYVAQLVSSLALPPRRLGPPELPLGGYSDVTNRGQPEQILPSQFALDDLEFVRRHAERELLYYRREEPHARTREELVVLLDQGVRTWGVVRLVLAAALVAFGRLAQRRRMPFWVATTSGGGVPCDPLQATEESLADVVQGSDLTAQPALALERTLQDESTALRDVVLLTHPLSLTEPDVAAAARRLRPGQRLFGLAVDGEGQVELSELRQGVPLRVSRFHVDLEPRPEEAPQPAVEPWQPWRGDVEPVGYPFRFGVEHDTKPTLLFAFDHAGDWLLTATAHGMLHATKTDGSATEVLPRGMVGGKLLSDVDAVVGVAGGFVVAGDVNGTVVAFHYEWARRICTAYSVRSSVSERENLAFARTHPAIDHGRWYYDRELHSVVWIFGVDVCEAIDLNRGNDAREAGPNSRAVRAEEKAKRFIVCLPPVLAVGASHPPTTEYGRVEVVEETGEVRLFLPSQNERRFTPLVDGQPTLRGYKLSMAQCYESTLALALRRLGDHSGPIRLCLYRIPEGVSLGEYKQPADQWAHTLSSDGRLLARQIGAVQVEIRPRGNSTHGKVVTARGGFHNGVLLHMGESFLVLEIERRLSHHVHWPGGELLWRLVKGSMHAPQGASDRIARLPSWLQYDDHRNRFQYAVGGNLIAAVDRFGQVFLFTEEGVLVCSLFAFQEELAICLPDGTCWGSEKLLGRRPTPDAAKHISARVLQAWWDGEATVV